MTDRQNVSWPSFLAQPMYLLGIESPHQDSTYLIYFLTFLFRMLHMSQIVSILSLFVLDNVYYVSVHLVELCC